MIELAEGKTGVGVMQAVEPQVAHQAILPRMGPAKQRIRQGVTERLSDLAKRIREIKPTAPVRRIRVHQRPQRGFD